MLNMIHNPFYIIAGALLVLAFIAVNGAAWSKKLSAWAERTRQKLTASSERIRREIERDKKGR